MRKDFYMLNKNFFFDFIINFIRYYSTKKNNTHNQLMINIQNVMHQNMTLDKI